jgi:hypothetical protein
MLLLELCNGRTKQGISHMVPVVPEQGTHVVEDQYRQREGRTNEQISRNSSHNSSSSNREHPSRRPARNVQQSHRQERGLQSRLHHRDSSVYSTHGGTVQENTRQNSHRPKVDLQRLSFGIEKSSGEYEQQVWHVKWVFVLTCCIDHLLPCTGRNEARKPKRIRMIAAASS